MKKGIHPEYVDTVVTCTCGNSFHTRSTITSGEIGPEFEKAGFPLVVFEPDKVAVVGFFMPDDGPHIAVGKHFHHLTESGGLGWVGGGCGFAGEYVAVVSHAA